jgi:hypothetical protein
MDRLSPARGLLIGGKVTGVGLVEPRHRQPVPGEGRVPEIPPIGVEPNSRIKPWYVDPQPPGKSRPR